MKYLLDTNVICEATSKTPEQSVLSWLDAYGDESCLSVITMGEIRKGLFRLPEGRRKRGLEKWVAELEKAFEEQILALDLIVMKSWGELYAKHEAEGSNLDVIDSLVAATALVHQLTVVTRNTKDFPPEVKTLNPWNF